MQNNLLLKEFREQREKDFREKQRQEEFRIKKLIEEDDRKLKELGKYLYFYDKHQECRIHVHYDDDYHSISLQDFVEMVRQVIAQKDKDNE